jgi:nucleoside-triphosphatase THEP1
MASAPHHLLLTDLPGCGKTTAVLHLAGFYTTETREGGGRVGFEAISLQAVLAHEIDKMELRRRWP